MEEIKEEQMIQIQIEKRTSIRIIKKNMIKIEIEIKIILEKKIMEIEEIIQQMTKAEKTITKKEKKMRYCQRYYLKQVKKK